MPLTVLAIAAAVASAAGPEMEFVRIEPGTFTRGDDDGLENERPAHRVTLTRGFEIGRYEVTQAQWEAVMGDNPSRFRGARLPVERVSWDDVQAFLRAMNALGDGYEYRLPSEAEWEYAARAGAEGADAGDLDQMGWYSANSGGTTHPVGEKEPNAWGLFDMRGNVWEWCQDWYEKPYYRHSPAVDPPGPPTGARRVCRGGAWSYSAERCRPTSRAHPEPTSRESFIGFRVVRVGR